MALPSDRHCERDASIEQNLEQAKARDTPTHGDDGARFAAPIAPFRPRMTNRLIVASVLIFELIEHHDLFAMPAKPLWLAARAGTVGAWFSVALAIKNRTVLPNLQRRDNYSDACLRIAIGFIAASSSSVLRSLSESRSAQHSHDLCLSDR